MSCSMTKEEFLKIKTYEEFDKRRNKLDGLDWSNQEIRDHLDSLFPILDNSEFEDGIIHEVYPF